MAPKLVCGLVLALTAGLICAETVTDKDTDKQQCALGPKERTDCGHGGISEKECLSKGCCFDSSIPEVIWCYYSKDHGRRMSAHKTVHRGEENKHSDKQQCALGPKERTDCGHGGISEKECLSKGCCFDSSIPEVIWCYHSKSHDKQQCALGPKERTDCGHGGISENECLSKGCCFDSSIPEVIWCYYSKDHDKRQCGLRPKERTDCGHGGISEKECLSKGCCFDSSIPEVIWCYHSKAHDKQQCGLRPKERTECGYLGIPEKDCLSKGCCFDSSIPEVIWCYHSKAHDKQQCGLRPKDRTECGYLRISEKECLSKGCCFDSSIPEVIWCYHSNAHGRRISAHETDHRGREHEHSDLHKCLVKPKERKDCGFPTISLQECHKKGCCFDSSIPEVPFCFFRQK
ncbi:uncharacterized protein LOC144772452 isoform X4 [Lissotriton helveticus]